MLRTIENGNLRLEHVDKEVELVGWVAKKRNFGQLVLLIYATAVEFVNWSLMKHFLNKQRKFVMNMYYM